jgi:hypothetical protein
MPKGKNKFDFSKLKYFTLQKTSLKLKKEEKTLWRKSFLSITKT